ncbi:MAG: T9SS type A sorting domain-containing protein [Bacteroidales bacterium]|nr:T9SS type A sorting domain-containing protein [Bacteroidales bacterium]
MGNNLLHRWFRAVWLPMLLAAPAVWSQTAGSWTYHAAFRQAGQVAVGDGAVYCAQPSGLFVYDINKKTLDGKTKADGLSEAGVTALAWDASTGTAVVGYANGTVDLLSGRRLHTVDAIRKQTQYAGRSIRHIYCHAGVAYLSCDFGLVLLDLGKRRLISTCMVGSAGQAVPVYGAAFFGERLYVATEDGLIQAPVSGTNLADYTVWQTVTLPAVLQGRKLSVAAGGQRLVVLAAQGACQAYDGTAWHAVDLPTPAEAFGLQEKDGWFYVTRADGVYVLDGRAEVERRITSYEGLKFAPRAAVGQGTSVVWIADHVNGLVTCEAGRPETATAPNGPAQMFSGRMVCANGVLYAAGGGADASGAGLHRTGAIHVLSGGMWASFFHESAEDFVSVAVSPRDASQWAAAAWGTGVVRYAGQNPTEIFTAANSPLSSYPGGGPEPGDVCYDGQGNLWVTQTYSQTPVAVLIPEGQWHTFAWPYNGRSGRLFFDDGGRGWLYADGQGMFLFSDGGTPTDESDDRHIAFYPSSAYGASLPTVNCLAQDRNGAVWAGTESGIVLYPSPEQLLSGQGLTGSHILVQGIEEPDKMYPLLGGEPVLSIAVDGANRKWIGTATSGVFLLSSDNKQLIKHFTASNSPLPDDRVTDICLSDVSSEVWFNTPLGLVSYSSDAVAAQTSLDQMYVYPNPVRPEYAGDITVTGLLEGTDVRITDVSGRLVYRATSTGGRVVWNGRLPDGRRPATGVYLIFCAAADGSESAVTKLLFVR